MRLPGRALNPHAEQMGHSKVPRKWKEAEVAQSCLTLRPQGLHSPWDSPARTLQWVAFPFSRGASQPGGQTRVSCIAGGFLTNWAIRESTKVIFSLKNPGIEKTFLTSTWTRVHAGTHALVHTRTRAHTHSCTHALMCTHTRVHTHTESTAVFAKVSPSVLPMLACPSCSSLALGSGEKLVNRTEQTACLSEWLAFQPASDWRSCSECLFPHKAASVGSHRVGHNWSDLAHGWLKSRRTPSFCCGT